MTISFSLIPGVMVGFEWVTEIEDVDDDSSNSYFVLDLLIVRVLVEY